MSCVAASAYCGPVWAEGSSSADPRAEDDTLSRGARLEMSVGAQTFSNAWSLYAGATAAPFASLDQDGLRLRAVGGYGAYQYSGRRAEGTSSRILEFNGQTAFADMLVGYQKQ